MRVLTSEVSKMAVGRLVMSWLVLMLYSSHAVEGMDRWWLVGTEGPLCSTNNIEQGADRFQGLKGPTASIYA